MEVQASLVDVGGVEVMVRPHSTLKEMFMNEGKGGRLKGDGMAIWVVSKYKFLA